MSHPLGVRPEGNAFLDFAGSPSSYNALRMSGLGSLCALNDALLLDVLHQAGGASLLSFSRVSKAGYAFSLHEDTWRSLVLEEFGVDFEMASGGSWRATWAARAATALRAPPPPPPAHAPPASAAGLYSTLLWHAHRCATAPIEPRWLSFDNAPRERGDLAPAAFSAAYDAANAPVVLRDGAAGCWPGREGGAWDASSLRAAHGGVAFHCAGFEWPLSRYLDYCARSTDDNPLYLFDKAFAEKAPALGRYTPPPAFGRDLLELLPRGERPDWRWLILGPAKSGSVWHQDPNGTQAFNACLQGRKKWLLLPPDLAPPGVWAAADGSQVCAPMSVVEWLLQFYAPYAKLRDARLRECDAAAGAVAALRARCAPVPARLAARARRARPVECVVGAGDVVFVPRGWWHCVLNLDPVNVAVTHNFCSTAGLPAVLTFLRNKPGCVSGVPQGRAEGLYARFRAALEREEPALLAEAEGQRGALPLLPPPPPQQQQPPPSQLSHKRRWADVVGGAGSGGGGFSLTSQWGAGGP
jgi:hypothetical protein